jgi:hypothetical protein
MSVKDPSKAIYLKFTKFPQNLLISSLENVVSFQTTNYFNKDEKFKFDFEGENLKIEIPDELESEIKFGPGETKDFNLKLNPSADGFGKLSIIIYWLKVIQFTVKVKKVRDVVPESKINEIIGSYLLNVPETSDSFNPESYINSTKINSIKKAEKHLEIKRKKYNEYPLLRKTWEDQKLQGEVGPEPILEASIEEIDNDIQQLAKIYLANKNPIRALELALEVSDENKKTNLYYNLIRAYSSIDLDGTIQILKNLTMKNMKYELIKNITLDQLKIDPEQAPKVAFLIEDFSVRQNLITEIILKTIKLNPEIAIKISQLIEDELLRIKILFNIVKELHDRSNKLEVLKLINKIIKIMEKSTKLNFSNNNYNNPAYNYYRDSIYILAETDSPKAVDSIILNFNLRKLKDKVAEDLFDAIYKMVDEIRTRFEPIPVFSQYYLFNTLTTNINEDIKNFSLKGGNVSSNILSKDMNFKVLLVSLFSYNFTIFPLIDRIYSELKFDLNKSLGYYIFPSTENHNEIELKTINNSLKQFIPSSLENNPNKLLIFNLDFIPYLGKPTIILSSEKELFEELSSKINESLHDTVNLINDNSLFKGGTTLDGLKQVFSSNNCKIINLLLSYEFINDYNIFKNFIKSLI